MKTKQVREINLFIDLTTIQVMVYRSDLSKDNYPQRLTSKLYDHITVASFMRCSHIGRRVMELLAEKRNPC